METDLFAAIRKRDTGVSTSFAPPPATPEHAVPMSVTPRTPQKTAAKHLSPLQHQVDEVVGRKTQASSRRVTVPEIREGDIRDLPATWRIGLDRLNCMPMPNAASAARWREIVVDAHRFAWSWHEEARAVGWSLASLVGYATDRPTGPWGAVLDLRSGRCVGFRKDHLDRDRMSILDRRGGYREVGRDMPDDAPLIWDLGAGLSR